VNDHELLVRKDRSRFVPERRWQAFDQAE
jgi:hypothetical protein